jgi:MFS family permease
MNRTFRFLFFASIMGQASNAVFALSRPLIMQDLRFNATAITTAAAIGSLVSLPLPLVVGRLSDRLGRKPLIVLCFFAMPLGLIVLATAGQIWQFWLASILQTILGISMVVSSALVTDMFADESLDTALSLLNATIWIGIVIGLSVGGVAINVFQMTPTLVVSVLVSLGAIGLLIPMEAPQRPRQEETSEDSCTARPRAR